MEVEINRGMGRVGGGVLGMKGGDSRAKHGGQKVFSLGHKTKGLFKKCEKDLEPETPNPLKKKP